MSGFSILVQPVEPVSHIRLLGEQQRKVNEFYALLQFLNTKLRSLYSLNHDWQCSLRILPQIIVNTCEGAGTKTYSKLIVAAKWCFFHNYRNKLFNGKPILRCGAAPFLFIFVILMS